MPTNPNNKTSSSRKDAFTLLKGVFGYLAKSHFALTDGHQPPAGQQVPADFAGICVASMSDPASDEQMLQYLEELGIRQVRLDYTYGDEEGHTARFLEQLLARSYRVLLRLVPPPEEAVLLGDEAADHRWRDFVAQTLDRFGAAVEAVELGNTVNRRKWSGFQSFDQFVGAWTIAHAELRRRDVAVAGPNVSDFEPQFNEIFLRMMMDGGTLPDIHTTNLFVERTIQPERYDRKVIGERLAFLHKLNLIKKARLLQRTSDRFGIGKTWSTTSFWTLRRVGRRILENEEKQADYLTRYMVLAAASGALGRAYWGPLVSQREGLIDDGSGQPAPHELVAFYGTNYGRLQDYRIRPAFHAFAQFARLIPGSFYKGRRSSDYGLEVHEFETARERVHVVWTCDTLAADLSDLYRAEDLAATRFVGRDGKTLDEPPRLATDSPVYLCWDLQRRVDVQSDAAVMPNVRIDGNRRGGRYYPFADGAWRGMVFAANQTEADRLFAQLHPDRVESWTSETILRKARNVIWCVTDPRNPERQLVVKKPFRLRLHKRLLEPFKSSKALRSWNGATLLSRAGLHSPAPVAFFERAGRNDPERNWYVCEYLPGIPSVREFMQAYSAGSTEHKGISRQRLFAALSKFLLKLHRSGVYFRDLAGGNILVHVSDEGELSFSLIDTARAQFFSTETPMIWRLSDLKRVCYKLSWPLRIEFMELYLGGVGKGRRFSWPYRVPFHYFDFKTGLKRRLRRRRSTKRNAHGARP